jgi:hypothetical protein
MVLLRLQFIKTTVPSDCYDSTRFAQSVITTLLQSYLKIEHLSAGAIEFFGPAIKELCAIQFRRKGKLKIEVAARVR